MSHLSNTVFLFSGQFEQTSIGGRTGLNPTIRQCVVIAENQKLAYECLTKHMPQFRPLGHATLEDYETTVMKLKKASEGVGTDWEVLQA